MQKVLTCVFAGAVLLGCGGSPELSCPAPGLPNPNPSYTDTLEGLVLVPTRANLRSASADESAAFRDLAAQLQAECADSPPASECEMAHLRAALVALPAPDHPALFTDIDGALPAARASASGDYPPAERDCDGQAADVCDARAVADAFVRASCELGGATSGGHS